MRTANRFRVCFGKTKVFYFAFLNQCFHGSGNIFNGHFGINTVLIQEINRLNTQSLKRCLYDIPDVLWTAIESNPFGAASRIKFETKFCGDDDLIAKRCERLADEFLVCERAINFCGVEECDAALNGLS